MALLFLFQEGRMTDQNKADIKRLRVVGNSYTQIAEILHLSRNTVKSICQRNAFLPGMILGASYESGCCPQCGALIVQVRGQKRKNFCSAVCRRAWWKVHRENGRKKTAIQVRCTFCGRMFEDYTRNHRKYCCHVCYIQDRFKKKESDVERAV